MEQFFNKYKSMISYLFYGVCTTLVNIFAYYACVHWLGLQNVASTFIAWVVSVVFAYFTNKVFVFESHSWKWDALLREMASFFACRGVTGAMDILIMYVGVDLMGMLDMGVKVFSNILVIILNYVMSKLLIFRRGASSAKGESPSG